LLGNVFTVFSVAIEMDNSHFGVVPDAAVALLGNTVHYLRDNLQVVNFPENVNLVHTPPQLMCCPLPYKLSSKQLKTLENASARAMPISSVAAKNS
jgi:hypothetical protein